MGTGLRHRHISQTKASLGGNVPGGNNRGGTLRGEFFGGNIPVTDMGDFKYYFDLF